MYGNASPSAFIQTIENEDPIVIPDDKSDGHINAKAAGTTSTLPITSTKSTPAIESTSSYSMSCSEPSTSGTDWAASSGHL